VEFGKLQLFVEEFHTLRPGSWDSVSTFEFYETITHFQSNKQYNYLQQGKDRGRIFPSCRNTDEDASTFFQILILENEITMNFFCEDSVCPILDM